MCFSLSACLAAAPSRRLGLLSRSCAVELQGGLCQTEVPKKGAFAVPLA